MLFVNILVTFSMIYKAFPKIDQNKQKQDQKYKRQNRTRLITMNLIIYSILPLLAFTIDTDKFDTKEFVNDIADSKDKRVKLNRGKRITPDNVGNKGLKGFNQPEAIKRIVKRADKILNLNTLTGDSQTTKDKDPLSIINSDSLRLGLPSSKSAEPSKDTEAPIPQTQNSDQNLETINNYGYSY